MKLFIATFALLAAAGASLFAATSPTVRIVVAGEGLATPLVITGESARQFAVWTGPGTRMNGVEGKEGFIIDWSVGPVYDRPAGLAQRKVTFFANRPDEREVYVVFYEYDPATEQGYVYLPPTALNTSSIYRGLEGRWFRATREWTDLTKDQI